MIPDFFVTITNEVFPGQAISFLQAKIVIKGGKSMFSDYFTKRFGIELAKSIKNLQSFLSEEKFIQDRPKLVVSSTISTQIERSLKKKKPKVEIEQIEVEEVGIDDDTKGELNANISMMRNRKTHLVKIQENMAEKNPFGTPVKRHSGHRNTKDIEYLEPYEYPNFGKYKGSPSKESYIYEDEEEKSNLIEPEIYSNGEHNEIIEEEKICTDTHPQSRHIEEEKNGEIKQEIQEENKGNDQSWRKL